MEISNVSHYLVTMASYDIAIVFPNYIYGTTRSHCKTQVTDLRDVFFCQYMF